MLLFLKPSLIFFAAVLAQNSMLLDRIWTGGTAPQSAANCDLKVLSWNIERGEQLQKVAASLEQMASALILLQEVDVNARRTGNKNIAEYLAQRLGMNYVFAAEFEELGQRTGINPAYHGQAILSALPAHGARVLRFRSQTDFWKPRWYVPNWSFFQRRTGGRIALVVELGFEPQRLVAYNVHLEGHGPDELRLRQIQEVIADIQRYPRETSIILAGDLNTRKPDAPAVNAILQAGFRKAAGEGTTTARGEALDWIFVRSPMSFLNGTIHRQVRASDHFPLSVQIRFETPDCRQ
jgi:endonuclease/exonuclease/phosphatase family metal-dependent hydrolase